MYSRFAEKRLVKGCGFFSVLRENKGTQAYVRVCVQAKASNFDALCARALFAECSAIPTAMFIFRLRLYAGRDMESRLKGVFPRAPPRF